MPELPEAQTISLMLNSQLKGKIIKKVELVNPKQFIGSPSKIIGKKITKVERLGKQIVFYLDNQPTLLIHLKMTGQLIFQNTPEKDEHTRIIFVLNKGILAFKDIRKFGWIKIINRRILKSEKELLGPDALSSRFSSDYLLKKMIKTSRPIKAFLLDQKIVSGIGNIYANEALFLARILPHKLGKDLTKKEIKRLVESIKTILKTAVKYEGTSSRNYIKPDKTSGSYQNVARVYQKKNCPKCHQTLKKEKVGGRSSFFCSNCQE